MEAAGEVAGEIEDDDGVLVRALAVDGEEVSAFEGGHAAGLGGPDAGTAGFALQHAHLAEAFAGADFGEGNLAADDLDTAGEEAKEGGAEFAFGGDPLARGEIGDGGPGRETAEGFRVEPCEDLDAVKGDIGAGRRIGHGLKLPARRKKRTVEVREGLRGICKHLPFRVHRPGWLELSILVSMKK